MMDWLTSYTQDWSFGPPLQGVAEYLEKQNAHALLTEDMYELLRKGETRTHELQNALAGHARNVGVLTAKGLMEFVTWNDGVASYRITEAGRKALLAHLGVMEIERPA